MPARGRHRRHAPHTFSRVSLRLTAGGAGIALPLAGAQFVHAAPDEDTWSKAASCESSGPGDVNTGDGRYVGLRSAGSERQAYGGAAYGQDGGSRTDCAPGAGLPRGERAVHTERADRAEAARAERPTTYEVVGGDTLFSIAQERGVEGGWTALYERNRTAVGGDPDMILPGQRLRLGGTAPKAEQPRAERAPDRGNGEAEVRAGAKKEQEEKAEAERRAAEAEEAKEAAAEQRAKERRAAAAAVTLPVSGAAPSTAYRASGSSWSSGSHTGVDFPVSTGTTVKAVSTGKVVSAGWADAYGYEVVVRHGDGKYSQYAHLSAISVRQGQSVNSGQRVGRSGATGNATGPHLHFEVRTGPAYGSDVDPLAYLRKRGVGS